MNSSFRARIEQALQRPIASREAGSLSSLNEAPAMLLEELRGLPPFLRLEYIRYLTDATSHPYVTAFVEEVIEGAESPEDWRRGRVLVPAMSGQALLQHSVQEIIRPLPAVPDEQWHRLIPNRAHWNARELLTGAPGLLRPDLDYRSSPPHGVIDILMHESGGVQPIPDVTIAARRWIASTIAGIAATRHLLHTVPSVDRLIDELFPGASEISPDAMIAIGALLAEQRLLHLSDLEVPGFRGPDEWYAGLFPADS